MGGIIEGGVGIGTKASPRRAAIEKAQVELRLEYDIREERRRELDFLEKGGNPLDFKFGITAPLSVQSSSLADQLNDQFGTCEAKGVFSSAASPLGDSIGSSGRLGATVACETNGADNFDGENEIIESEGNPRCASRSKNTPSEHSSQLGGSQNVRESEDSPIFHPKKAYRRRNRTKNNRDSARLSGIDIGSRGAHNSSLSDHRGVVSESAVHESPSDTKADGSSAAAADPTVGGLSEGKLDMSSSKHMDDEPLNQNVNDEDGVSTAMTSVESDPCMGREQKITAVSEFLACSGAEKPGKDGGPEQESEPVRLKGDGECTQTVGGVISLAVTSKGLDSESSCTRTSVSVVGNRNSHSKLCTMMNVDSIGEQIEQNAPLELTENIKSVEILQDRKMADIAENGSCINDNQSSQICIANGFLDKDQEETGKIQLSAQYEAKCIPCAEGIQPNHPTDSVLSLQQGSLDDSIYKADSHSPKKPEGPHCSSMHELTKTEISCPVSVPELQPSDGNLTNVVDKAHEDRILERARNIMAKRKIIEELSLGSLPKEYCHKTHWDFVLEEMAWMANDFAQERVWKRTAATQLCHRAAFASRLRFGERDKHTRDKAVAETLAKAVMDFWHSAALLVGVNGNGFGLETCAYGTSTSENMDGNNNAKVESGGHNKVYVKKNIKLAIQGYAARFLQLNSSVMPVVKNATSRTVEGASTVGTHGMTYQNQHVEEDLFYAVPCGAMEDYRRSVERYLLHCLRFGKNMQEEVNTSMYNAVGEFGSQENGYGEDEGENAYYLPWAFEVSKASKFAQKKRKNPKLYTPRSYEVGVDFSYGHCIKNRIGISQSAVKRPANGINACPIPTKRVRTASRQRVVGPFSSGAAGFMSVPSRTDASSGDTNSFQGDQSLHGGSLIPKGLEVESGMDYDKQSAFDAAEITAKPKKKKTKHQGMAYEQRWQADCSMQIEQRDHFKKRLESHLIDLNGNNDPFVSHAKKPKITKQSLENSFENGTLLSGSSPVGSQMSNMSNPNKFIKLIGGRDRGRKTKSLKMVSVQTGSGSLWSLFEDQALVVLVHDMGPNWELVSDAINSTLHFKCIFRKPQECKERHAILLEKSWGDGADTEDSGSSQPYPSTLPGIPKGGARQLFQQLRGPMEEDTIKSHFAKIILIGQQLHGRKQEPKQLVLVHSSHLGALSQVMTTNMNGCVLTPLDLCDMASSSPDVFSGGYQGPHTGSLPLPNQAVGQSMLPSSSTSTSLQVPSSNLASPSAQANVPVRDGRYGVPKASLPIDEQQRIQQYSHLLSSRNLQQPNLSAGTFSGNDVGGRILPGGNGMPMPRSGLQGISGSAASNMVGIPSSLNMQPGASVGQGNSMLRPRDALMMRVPNANSRGVPSLSGLSSAFPSQSASPSGPTYPVQQQHQMHQQQSNVLTNSHHPHLQGSAHSGSTEQAFAMNLARERHLQQRMLQRQQQQHHQPFPTSGALMPHVPSQSQLPVSITLQNSSQVQSPATSQPLTPSSPVTPVPSQQQQKHQLSRHGRTAQSAVGGMTNQVGKQRQNQSQQLQQQQQQSGRHHPPQRQPPQSQQQAKLLKGMGKGNTLMHQHHPIDSSHLNGLSSNPGSQPEKGEPSMNLIQGQVYPSQSSKPAAPPPSTQSHPQHKPYTNSAPASSKQVHLHADSSTPSQAAPAVPSAPAASTSNQQLKVHQHPPVKLVNQRQPNIHKAVSPNNVLNSDTVTEPQNDKSQAEQQLANSMSGTSGIPPKCAKSANAAPASDAPNGSSVSNSQLGPVGNTSMSNSPGNESIAPGAHGLVPKQPLNSLSPSLGTQRKQIQQLQTTLPNQVLLQQKHEPHQQQLLEQSSQRQPLLRQHPQPQVQTSQSNTFTRSSNANLE